MKVKDAMHKGAICVEPHTPVREIARTMRREDIGAVPVSSNGELLGIVTDRDLACRALADGVDISTLTAWDVMTRGAIYCHENDDLRVAIGIMEDRRVRRLPVINFDHVVGMLSLGDVSRATNEHLSSEVLRSVSGHHV